ncbi:UDP-glucuronosyl/UDP-glucosyltransferase family-containing protein [Strongyloides ratti]|uniref:glucuronosyltransferase n=1 Tax=Strongyloides ratti TaxID=34506 RepID=A0A090L0U3_STRRB|nr:UDP-glucuronosyl/UDP-glucosyltransferase family-containing protein [Strongyloides ratti]CEF61114.1 UDP-glucuronosyl/UDP-glucosyltransferase family-containing protein [Strongyloides ratti]
MYYFFFFIILQLFFSVQSLKVLVYSPKVGHSHINFNGRIADILVKAGHDVTFLAPKLTNMPYTNGTKLAKVISVEPDLYVAEKFHETTALKNMWNLKEDVTNAFDMFSTISNLFLISCEHLINQKELTKQIINEKYDIMIAEYFTTCPLGLVDHYNISSLIITSAMTFNDIAYPMLGLNFPSSYIPGSFMPFKEKMTYKERIINTLQYITIKYYLENILFKKYEELFSRKTKTNFYEAKYNIGGVFINTVPWMDFPFPITPKIHFIGGSGVPEPKNLTKQWNDILSLRKKNILLSFGSVAQSFEMPDSYKKGILIMMKELKNITFIWKYEKEPHTLPYKVPKNVFISKWIPQNDLLNDDRITIFITHGGLNSITEAISRGKVTLTVPLFGDQIRNAQMVERLNISKVFSKKNLSNSKLLIDTITYLLNNIDFYSKNVYRQQLLMKNRPFSAEETIIKITEFVGKHGNLPEMDLYSTKMSTVVFYNLDIILPALFILLLLISGIIIAVIYLIKSFNSIRKTTKID